MSSEAQKRLMRDFMKLQSDPFCGATAAPSEESIMEWEGVIFGAVDSPFQDGTFQVKLTFPDEYPAKPPTVKFVSKMFHPNVKESNGLVCIDILKDKWLASYDVQAILVSIHALLDTPNTSSPLNSHAAELYNKNRKEFEKRALECVKESWDAFNDDNKATGNAVGGTTTNYAESPTTSAAALKAPGVIVHGAISVHQGVAILSPGANVGPIHVVINNPPTAASPPPPDAVATPAANVAAGQTIGTGARRAANTTATGRRTRSASRHQDR